jgi:hypothetical protein
VRRLVQTSQFSRSGPPFARLHSKNAPKRSYLKPQGQPMHLQQVVNTYYSSTFSFFRGGDTVDDSWFRVSALTPAAEFSACSLKDRLRPPSATIIEQSTKTSRLHVLLLDAMHVGLSRAHAASFCHQLARPLKTRFTAVFNMRIPHVAGTVN